MHFLPSIVAETHLFLQNNKSC